MKPQPFNRHRFLAAAGSALAAVPLAAAERAPGSYETWRGRTSPLATNAIPRITEAFWKLLGAVKP
jgi:hypothetical protein